VPSPPSQVIVQCGKQRQAVMGIMQIKPPTTPRPLVVFRCAFRCRHEPCLSVYQPLSASVMRLSQGAYDCEHTSDPGHREDAGAWSDSSSAPLVALAASAAFRLVA
jgi:hypothetical protein